MPDQVGIFGVHGHGQTPSVSGVGVIAKAVRRHKNGADVLQLGQGGDAKNELAGAAGDDDAPRLYTVKRRQLAAQCRVTGVRIPRSVCLRDSQLCNGARAAGVAVGGKVKRW